MLRDIHQYQHIGGVFQIALSLKFISNKVAYTKAVLGGSIVVNPTKPRRYSRRSSNYEMLN